MQEFVFNEMKVFYKKDGLSFIIFKNMENVIC